MPTLVDRRRLMAALGGAVAWPLAVRAQQPAAMPRIGILWHAGSEEEEKTQLDPLRQGLRNLGYREGQNIQIEMRFPAEKIERFYELAVQLVELKVDVLVAVTLRAALAARRATSTIPIVFVAIPDPIGSGLVDSLARPAGNITGLSTMAVELTPKRLQFLKDALGDLSRVALLLNATDIAGTRRYVEAARVVADPLGVSIVPIGVSAQHEFNRAFSEMKEKRLQAVVLGQDGLFFSDIASAERLCQLAIDHNLPMVAYRRELARIGAFMSYGPDMSEHFRRLAIYIDKLLKGAKPADLPVEQPTRLELLINMKTAKALGLEVPPILLARADEVIE